MKAEVVQQRSLLELAEIDAELSRIEHRAGHLAEQQQLRADSGRAPRGQRPAGRAAHRAGGPGRRRWRSSRPRSTRCASARTGTGRCSTAGAINAKQLAELQHELETLERRQSSLEDSLLEVMERREELQTRAGRRAGAASTNCRASCPQPSRRATRRTRDDRADPAPMSSRGVTNCVGAGCRSGRALRTPARARWRRGRGTAAGPPVRCVPDRDRPRRAGPDLRRRR